MIKKCVFCKQPYETHDLGQRSVCPNCNTSQKIMGFGCLLIVFVILITYLLGVAIANTPSKDTRYAAKSYARLYIARQMRKPQTIIYQRININKINQEWVISGVVSCENMMGGRSYYTFTLKLKHIKSKPYWLITDYILSEAY